MEKSEEEQLSEPEGWGSKITSLHVAIAVALIAIVLSAIYQVTTVDYATVTVKRLERENKRSGDSRYIVTGVNEVFQNTDAIMHWKWDSSDVQRKLEVGETYKVKVYGWRIPILSMYRNIVQIEDSSQ